MPNRLGSKALAIDNYLRNRRTVTRYSSREQQHLEIQTHQKKKKKKLFFKKNKKGTKYKNKKKNKKKKKVLFSISH